MLFIISQFKIIIDNIELESPKSLILPEKEGLYLLKKKFFNNVEFLLNMIKINGDEVFLNDPHIPFVNTRKNSIIKSNSAGLTQRLPLLPKKSIENIEIKENI